MAQCFSTLLEYLCWHADAGGLALAGVCWVSCADDNMYY